MTHTFVLITVLAYLLSMGLYTRYLYTGQELTGKFATLLMFLGLAAHYVSLLLRARGTHTVPYHDLQGSMSLFGWLLAVTYLCLEIYHRQRTVGAFVVPIILVFFFAAYLVPNHPGAPIPAKGVVFALACDVEHLVVLGVCAVVCVEPDVFGGRTTVAHAEIE